MKCNQCAHVQESGMFCSKCGTPFQAEEHVNDQQHVHVEQKGQATKTPIHKQKEKTSINLQNYITIGVDWKTVVGSLIPLFVLLVGSAWAVSYMLQSSTIIRDLTYAVLAAGESISSTHIATLVAHMSITLWDVLLVSHAAPATGVLHVEGMADVFVSWKLPIILAPIMTIIVIAVIFRLVKKIRPIERDKHVPVWLMSSVGYALIMAILLFFLTPTYEIDGMAYVLSISFPEVLLHTFVVGVIGTGIGLQVYQRLFTKKTGDISWLRAMRPIGSTILIWLSIASVIQIGTWFFMHPGAVYSTPLVSPSSLGDVYKTDILFYLLLPTYFIGEFLYALGATLHLSSSAITNALYVPQMTLHTWTGVDLQAGTQGSSYTDLIQSATRFTLGSFISLLIYIYAVSKVNIRSLKDHVKQLLTIGIITLIVAYGTTMMIEMTGSPKGTIGFSPIAASVMVMIISACIGTLKYVISKWMNKQEDKAHGGEQDGKL